MKMDCMNACAKCGGDTRAHDLGCENDPIEGPMGWECPRCSKVHAPWVAGCDCVALYVDNTCYHTTATCPVELREVVHG